MLDWLATNVLSVIGLLFSIHAEYKAYKAKKMIDRAINKTKINESFITKHSSFIQNIDININEIKEGQDKEFLLITIKQIIDRIRRYSEDWEITNKNYINNFYSELENYSQDDFKKEEIKNKIIENLSHVKNILEFEGELHGIRQN